MVVFQKVKTAGHISDQHSGQFPAALFGLHLVVEVLVSQLCLTLCNPMDCGPPGSSVHGTLQARILEWGEFPSPGDLPSSGIKPKSPTLQADSLLVYTSLCLTSTFLVSSKFLLIHQLNVWVVSRFSVIIKNVVRNTCKYVFV